MLGFAMGLVCGVIESLLLRRFVAGISQGTMPLSLIAYKLLVLAVTLTACVLLARDQLIWAACGIAAPLIIGSIGQMVVSIASKKKEDLERDVEHDG